MAHSKFLVEQLRTLDSRLARSKIDYSKLDIDTSRQCNFQRRCSHEHLRDNLQSRAILENENAEDAHVTHVRGRDEKAFGRYLTKDLAVAYMNALAAGDLNSVVPA
jgi:hypothetical protein